jgi:L-glyceraldehyde 3-phosphate reductase
LDRLFIADEKRYEQTPYLRAGKSGLRLPVLSLGLWHNFGGGDNFETMKAMTRDAFNKGINYFDLANNYGPPPGSAEVNFGKILKEDFAAYRDEIIVATKAGYLMWPGPYGEWGSRKYLLSSLDASLKRLKLDYVDLFYSHRFDPNTDLEETMGALAHAVKSGKALYVGISNYGPDQTREAVKILRSMGVPCLVNQVSYSMLNRNIEKSGLIPVCDELGVGLVIFSPLAQGQLTDKYLSGIPSDSRAAKGGFLKPAQITPERVEIIKKLNAIALNRGQNLSQLALAWVMRHKSVVSALIGASRVSQIDDCHACLKNLNISADELAEIDKFIS